MRLTPVGGALLDELSRRRGISKTALIETMLRDTAEARGIPIPSAPKATASAAYDPSKDPAFSGEWTDEDMRDFTAAAMRRFDDEEVANANV